MPDIEILEDKIIIRLSRLEKILILRRRDIEIPIECIREVKTFRDLDENYRSLILPRFRLLGFQLGKMFYGLFSTGLGRGLFYTRNIENTVIIFVKEQCKTPYKANIIVVDTPDTQKLEKLTKQH